MGFIKSILFGVSYFCVLGLYAKEPSPKHAVFQTTDTMCAETRFMDHALEYLHYARAPIASLDMAVFLRTYLEQLDPFHLLFTEGEIKNLELRFSDSLPFYLKQGNLFPAFEIFTEAKEKSKRRVDWILLRLEEPFDFDTEESFIPDRRKLPWPQDLQEADLLWVCRLQFDLINEILGTLLVEPSIKRGCLDWQSLLSLQDVWGRSLMQTAFCGDLVRLEMVNEPFYCMVWNRVESLQPAYQEAYAAQLERQRFEANLTQAIMVLKDRYQRMRDRLLELEANDVAEAFLSSLARQYDPHSSFLSADSMEDFSISIRNSLVGIGAVLSDEEGYCTIRELIPGGPAAKSKELKPGDSIVGIGQSNNGPIVDVIGLKLREVVRMIRGEKGTSIRLLIRPGEGDPSVRKTVILIREEVEITSSLAQAELFEVPGKDRIVKIGVIDLPAFYGSEVEGKASVSTTEDVKELIAKLKAAGAEALILDIRRNGGGLLGEAISLTGLFITTGPVLQAKDTLGHLSEFLDEDSTVAWEGPLIVLVSRYSASASEILAGALKDSQRALIVGDPATHGKGTVQAILEIDRSAFTRHKKQRMGSAKITVQKWYRPFGTSTQLKGVASDIILPSINPCLPIGEGDLPRALSWDSIRPVPWCYDRRYTLEDNLIFMLKQKSDERQKNLQELLYLQESVDWFRHKQEEKSFSLNREKRHTQKKAEAQFHTKMEEKFKSLDRSVFPSTKIFLEAALLANEKVKQSQESSSGVPQEDLLETLSAEPAARDKGEPTLDIHLRETLRIMRDWLTITETS